MPVRWLVWIGLFSVGVAGCATLTMSDSQARIVPGRLIALPPLVSELELDEVDRLTPRPDWQAEASPSVEAALGCRLKVNGGRGPSGVKWNASDPSYVDFRRWSSDALDEIVLTVTGKMSPRHESVTEWEFPGNHPALRGALRADFALVTIFRDGQHTVARQVVNALGSHKTFLIRDGLACVVDLSNGRIVWCQHGVIPNVLTLRTRPEAQEFVDELLRNLRKVSTTHWEDGGVRAIAAIRGSDCGSEFRAPSL